LSPPSVSGFGASTLNTQPKLCAACGCWKRTPARTLKGTKSAYRLTAGEYRILYEIDYDARVVTVFRIMHRGEGY